MNHRRFCGPVDARFWAKVDKENGPVMPGMATPCWEWRGARSRKGYGTFSVLVDGRRTNTLAHRFAWVLVNGPMPDGHEACHRCHNRGCVRPDHVYAGTHHRNMRDAVERGTLLGRNVSRGEGHYLTKLSDSDIEQLRLLRALDAAPTSVLAALFGTTEKHAAGIIQMRKRRELGPPVLLASAQAVTPTDRRTA